ncbi:MAG: esterase-like activity of phytase family protein [Epsilonproteobacteria bacterium]|nr:MAG: esterase-like activity of phytase family protein [Campylobacterota bacterium]
MKIIFFLLLVFSFLEANVLSVNITPTLKDNTFMGIKILDQKHLTFKNIQGIKFSEISDLAYDEQMKKLYLVGDEGKLFAFHILFKEKMREIEPLGSAKLKKKNGKKFKKWRRDSEGMTFDGEGHLLISFEEKAKIGHFDSNLSQDSRMLYSYPLPPKLQDTDNYRSKNKILEALAWHPKYGILTAAEWPLKKENKKHQTIYALSGKEWHFKAEKEAKSALVAMEVMDDGNLLVMERSFTGLLDPFVLTLKKVYINNNNKKAMCQTKILAKMNSHKGWNMDNFEGLAKVAKGRYVMVSDNNDNFFQKTLLIYFEVLD